MRVLVCGSHNRSDPKFIYAMLDGFHASNPISCLIEGGARHVDHVAMSWAVERGVPRERYNADWARWGNRAGPIRNAEMLVQGRPDVVMAFFGGGGTANMVKQTVEANAKGQRIRIIDLRWMLPNAA